MDFRSYFSNNIFPKAIIILFLFLLFLPSPLEAQPSLGGSNEAARSFAELFPGIGEDSKREIFSQEGLIRTIKKGERLEFTPASGSGIDLAGEILKTNPSYIAESLLIIPYGEKNYDRLDAYNALSKIRDLKGRLYHSHTRSAEVPLFEDATRIESAQQNTPVPDPPLAMEIPISETAHIRLKDINFGNTFYLGEINTTSHGISYKLTNFRNITYLLFTVMKEGKFSAVLYMEALTEGMLLYSMAGADTSNFIASMIDIPSAISKRLAVFIGWIGDGLKAGNH